MKTPIEMTLDGLQWREVAPEIEPSIDNGLPHVTHEGLLTIGDVSLRCYQLSDGSRVFDADDAAAFFGGEISGGSRGEGRRVMKVFAFTPKVFTIDAAAHYLGVSKRTVEEWIANNVLKTHRLPGTQGDEEFLKKTHILKRELDRLIERGVAL